MDFSSIPSAIEPNFPKQPSQSCRLCIYQGEKTMLVSPETVLLGEKNAYSD